MVLAIISDTHLPRGQRQLPDVCLARLRGADHILHAGDLMTVAVLEQLRALGPPLSAVHGNVDEPALRDLLPKRLELELEGVRIGMIHDASREAGRLERLRERFPGCSAVVFGHSHIPLIQRSEGFAIFNPGSATDRRRQPEHTMGMARLAHGSVEFEHVGLGP
jgi:putative phosphoesterase